jgi:hypothetical protein
MKKRSLIAIFFTALILLFTMQVQAQGRKPEAGTMPKPEKMPEVKSSSELAKDMTGELAKELALSASQEKKVYKLMLKEADMLVLKNDKGKKAPVKGEQGKRVMRDENMPSDDMMQGDMMQGGMMPPQGGGGGMMPGGGGGMRQGGKGMGQASMAQSSSTQKVFSEEEFEKLKVKNEKKMKKILTKEQFTTWKRIEDQKRKREFEKDLNGGLFKR